MGRDLDERAILEEVLQDKYRIEEEVGRGGFGVVFRATDLILERPVAIKTLLLTLMDNEELVRRFMQEAKIAARLQHQNIVTIYQVGQAENIRFFIMEFVEGITIKKYLQENKVFSAALAVKIAKGICRALHYAHSKGVIHRDIKPENIIIDPRERPVVTDFGIAKPMVGSDLTRTNISLGTPLYMSPEQIRGERVDHRSDQYSFGVLMFRMLTGRLPFQSNDLQALTYMHLHEDPPQLRRFNPGINEDLEAIVLRTLKKYPHERYSDIFELLKDLERVDVYSMSGTMQDLVSEPVASDDQEQRAADAFRRGMAAFKAKDYKEAQRLLEEVLGIDPDHDEALYYVDQAKMKQRSQERITQSFDEGLAFYKDGKFSDAIRAWSRIIAVDPSNQKAVDHINMAKAAKEKSLRAEKAYRQAEEALRGKRYTEALKLWSKVLAIDENFRDVVQRIQQTRDMIRHMEDAAGLLEKVRELLMLRQFQDAADELSKVLEFDPDSKPARELMDRIQGELSRLESIPKLYQLGRKSADAGDYATAIRLAREVLAIEEHNADAFLLITECEAALERGRRVSGLLKQAEDLEANQRFGEALELLRQALTLEPEHGPSQEANRRIREELARRERCTQLLDAARNHLKQNALEDAAEALTALLELDPDNATALDLRQQVTALQQIKQRRIDQFDAAVSAFHDGELTTARRLLQQLLDEVPDYPDGQVWLARCQIELDRREHIENLMNKARLCFDAGDLHGTTQNCHEILRFQGNHAQALDLLDQVDREQLRRVRTGSMLKKARAALTERRFEEAEEFLSKVLNDDPDNGEAQDVLSDARAQRQQFEQQLRQARIAVMLEEAAAAVDRNDFKGAHDLLAEIFAEDPDNADARNELDRMEQRRLGLERQKLEHKIAGWLDDARKLIADGNFDRAEKEIQRTMAEVPDHPNAAKVARELEAARAAQAERQRQQRVSDIMSRARKSLRDKELDKADELMCQAQREDPRDQSVAAELAALRSRRAHHVKLHEQAQRALSEAKFESAITAWRAILDEDPQFTAANEGVAEAERKQTRATSLMSKAEAAYRDKDLEIAERHLSLLVSELPEMKSAATRLQELQAIRQGMQSRHENAQTLFRSGKFSEAITIWRQILSIDARHAGAEDGIVEAERTIRLERTINEALAAARDAFGRGKWQEARDALTKAKTLAPSRPEVESLLTEIQAAEETEQRQRKADTHLDRANRAIKNGNLKRAAKELGKAREAAPDYPLVQETQAALAAKEREEKERQERALAKPPEPPAPQPPTQAKSIPTVEIEATSLIPEPGEIEELPLAPAEEIELALDADLGPARTKQPSAKSGKRRREKFKVEEPPTTPPQLEVRPARPDTTLNTRVLSSTEYQPAIHEEIEKIIEDHLAETPVPPAPVAEPAPTPAEAPAHTPSPPPTKSIKSETEDTRPPSAPPITPPSPSATSVTQRAPEPLVATPTVSPVREEARRRLVLVAITCAALLTVFFAGSFGFARYQRYERGLQFQRQTHARFQELLKEGTEKLNSGDPVSAVLAAGQAYRLEPEQTQAKVALRQSLEAVHQKQSGQSGAANRSEQIAPLLQQGISAFNDGRFDASRTAMEQVLAIDGENEKARFYLTEIDKLAASGKSR